MPTDPIRGLLFAIFAIHLDFITRDQLTTAIAAWIRQPTRPMAEILVDQKALDPRTRTIVEDVVARHLEQHGGDAERSVALLGAKGLIPPELAPALGESMTSDAVTSASAGVEGTDASDPVSLQGYAAGGTRYQVLRPQDRGGMGEVFVARDLELGREVLLKQLPERRAADPRLRAAFLKEVRAGAALEHPNIAPVYDVGQYSGGQLFEVMRLIPGGTFQRAIRDHHASRGSSPQAERVLRFRELLGHLVDACQAIEYAHSRGVLHRDIKPSNIMLGSFGETQVIDWGLARVSGHDLSGGTGSPAEPLAPAVIGEGSHPTADGEFKGTPAYASPEQADGKIDQIDARSDVYGLGATLYCLLTGEAPFRSQSPFLIQDVRRGRFPRPRQVRADIPPALESICLKAMAHAQKDRYPSPRDLAIDIERWLADEPVVAHADPILVRVRRWGLRHRTAVAAAAALLLTSLVGLGIGYVAVKEQRDVAESNASKARHSARLAKDSIGKYLVDFANDDLPAVPNSEAKRIAMVEEAVRSGRSLLELFPEDTTLREGLDRSLLHLANLKRVVADYDEVESLYEEATESLSRLAEDDPGHEKLRGDLCLARYYRGASIRQRDPKEVAESYGRESLEIARRFQAEFPDSPIARRMEALAAWGLAETLGKGDEACSLMAEASRNFTALAERPEAAEDLVRDAALLHCEAARMFRSAGRHDEARAFSFRAAKVTESLVDRPPSGGLGDPLVAQVRAEAVREWATDLTDDAPAAIEALGTSIAIVVRLVKEKPDVVFYRQLLVDVLADRSERYLALGQDREALADARQAVAEGEALVAKLAPRGSLSPDIEAALERVRDLEARIVLERPAHEEPGAASD